MPDDDDILEISAEDLADESLPPAPPDTAPVLDLTLDDVADDPAAGAFPALTADQLLAGQSSITIRTLCSSTGRPFLVRYVEDRPGLFVTRDVTVPGKDANGAAASAADRSAADASASSAGVPPAPVGEVRGAFQTAKDYACPFCGSHAVLVCGRCGVDLCAGPGDTGRCTCPNCQAQIEAGGRATSATGLLGLGKGRGKK